jgi:branched-chain amino acid transport system permease protein
VLILSALITGIATGSMYGLLALGFHVTWAVSRTVNFAQGSSMMLGAVLLYGLAVTHSCPVPSRCSSRSRCAACTG